MSAWEEGELMELGDDNNKWVPHDALNIIVWSVNNRTRGNLEVAINELKKSNVFIYKHGTGHIAVEGFNIHIYSIKHSNKNSNKPIITLIVDLDNGKADFVAPRGINYGDEIFSSSDYFSIVDLLCVGFGLSKVYVNDNAIETLCTKLKIPSSAILFLKEKTTYPAKFGYVAVKIHAHEFQCYTQLSQVTGRLPTSINTLFGLGVPRDMIFEHILLLSLSHIQNKEECELMSVKTRRWIKNQFKSLDLPIRYVKYFKGPVTQQSEIMNIVNKQVDVRSALSSSSSSFHHKNPILHEYKLARRRGYDLQINPKGRNKVLVPKFRLDHVLKRQDGLVSLTHLEIPRMYGTASKHILLCGDLHNDKPLMGDAESSQFVMDWIVSALVKEPNKCLDIFIEHAKRFWITRGPAPSTTAINTIPVQNILGNVSDYVPGVGPMAGASFSYMSIIKKFKNVRIHDVNPRIWYSFTRTDKPGILVKLFSIYENIYYIYEMLLAVLFHIEFEIDLRKICDVKMLDSIKKNDLITCVKNEIIYKFHCTETLRKINKQIEKSEFKNYRETYFITLFISTMDTVVKTHILDISSTDDVDDKYSIIQLYLYVPIMDAYCLARMFRVFKRGGTPCTKIVKTCIVYAGQSHIEIYRAFIRNYFGRGVITHVRKVDMANKHFSLSRPVDLTAL